MLTATRVKPKVANVCGDRAIQDRIAGNLCFGCGIDNPHGLQIKSCWNGEDSICEYQPQPHQAAGPRHVLNGGIIATLIDCHSVCTAIDDAYRRAGRPTGTGEKLWYATGKLNIKYLRPTPIDKPVRLVAKIVEFTEKKTILACRLSSGDDLCATAEVTAVRVPTEWTEPR